jgi:hypothetical protein
MSRTSLVIETVVEPLPRCSQWSGKARTARRSYEWFYSPDDERQDGGRIAVMANRPEGSNYYWYLRTVPPAFKVEIKRAVAAAKGCQT